MDELQIGIIGLVKSALTGEKAHIPENFDWNKAIKTARKHQIMPMIYYGIQYSGIIPPAEIMSSLELETFTNVMVSQKQLYALDMIYKAFDENEADYMPLKGSILKYIYPKPEMRPMSDADVLIKQEQYENKIHPIMTSLGFDEVVESNHELIWDKKGVLHIELHKRLIPSYNKDYYEYYGDGWRFAERKGDCRYEMKDEDNYVYLFTHYAKHYRDGGIGIRHMTDIYIFSVAKPLLDFEYIEKELEKLKLLEFYKNTKHTLDVWFTGVAPDEMTDFITAKIFGSGSYGTHDAHVLSEAVKISKSADSAKSVKLKKWSNLVFLPYEAMREKYPILKKIPILLPFMWVVRIFKTFLFKRNKIKSQQSNMNLITDNKINVYQNELSYVGLDFNFKE